MSVSPRNYLLCWVIAHAPGNPDGVSEIEGLVIEGWHSSPTGEFGISDPEVSSEGEVINDLDPGLMKWYQDLKKRSRFSCDLTPDSDKWRRIRKKAGPLGFCDYLHLLKFSYGCKGMTYSSSKVKRCLESEDPSTCTVTRLAGNFDRFRDRLSRTRILKRDYRDILKKYDGSDTFFYLDPPFHELSCPYVSCETNPRQIADAVRGLRGMWLLSYNDHPDVRAAFKGYKIEKFENQYSMDEDGTKQVVEVLIRNY